MHNDGEMKKKEPAKNRWILQQRYGKESRKRLSNADKYLVFVCFKHNSCVYGYCGVGRSSMARRSQKKKEPVCWTIESTAAAEKRARRRRIWSYPLAINNPLPTPSHTHTHRRWASCAIQKEGGKRSSALQRVGGRWSDVVCVFCRCCCCCYKRKRKKNPGKDIMKKVCLKSLGTFFLSFTFLFFFFVSFIFFYLCFSFFF